MSLESGRDVEEAIRQLLDAFRIDHRVPEGEVYRFWGKTDGDTLTISMRPGAVLILFGPPDDIREPDKERMREDFRVLQEAIIDGRPPKWFKTEQQDVAI